MSDLRSPHSLHSALACVWQYIEIRSAMYPAHYLLTKQLIQVARSVVGVLGGCKVLFSLL